MLDLYSTEHSEDYYQRSSASFCSAAVCFAGDQGLHWHLAVPSYGHQNFDAVVASQPQEQCRCLSPHPPGASINLRIVMSGHSGSLFSRSTTELVLCFRIARHPVLAVQRFQCPPPHQADYHPNRQLGSAPSNTRQATHIFAILTGAGTWSVWTAVVDSTGPIADSPAIRDGSAAFLEPTADLRSRISVLYVPDVVFSISTLLHPAPSCRFSLGRREQSMAANSPRQGGTQRGRGNLGVM